MGKVAERLNVLVGDAAEVASARHNHLAQYPAGQRRRKFVKGANGNSFLKPLMNPPRESPLARLSFKIFLVITRPVGEVLERADHFRIEFLLKQRKKLLADF